MTDLIQTNSNKLQRLTKYILMGLIVIIATRYIPDNTLKTKEIIMIGATSSISFAILDMVSPTIKISRNARTHAHQQTQQKISETKDAIKSQVLVEAFYGGN